VGVQPGSILLPPTADQGPIGRHDLRVDERCDELTGKGEPEQDESYPRPPGSPSPAPPLNLRLARPTLHAPRCLDRGVIETHCRDHAKAQPIRFNAVFISVSILSFEPWDAENSEPESKSY
jgi:hypothetical protein